MNKQFNHLFQLLGCIWSYLFPPICSKAFRSIRDKAYTGYIRRRFAQMGDSYFIWKPYHLEGTEFITIGENTIFEPGLQLTAWKTEHQTPKIEIGNNCMIRRDAHITACNNITIGNSLLTGTNVFISDNSHGRTDFETLRTPTGDRPIVSKGPVHIGNNVWLGNNVCVLSGVTIGDGVVVGANSVVTHDIPAYSIAVGIPAEVIKQVQQ